MTDLYALLGVTPTTDVAALKRAWLVRVRQLHPDLHANDPAKATELAAVNAAYDVLSDPERRRNYDQYGEDAASVFFDANRVPTPPKPQPGVPRERRARPVERGEDLTALLPLTLAQARTGGIHTLTIQAARTCPTCQGTGWRRAGRACSKCEGGKIPGLGPYRVQIPPGVLDGAVLIAPELGRAGRGKNAPPGDLHITVSVPADFRSEADGTALDLPCDVRVIRDGGVLEIPMPNGGTAKVRVRADAPPGQRIRLPGRGHRGADLLVRPVPRPGPIDVAAVVVDLRSR
jgi:DnaJ-class molecular chaperone